MTPVATPETGTTRDKVQVMVQACADILGEAIVRHTEDWHMLQRIFVDDLEDRGAPEPSTSAATS